MASVLTDGMDSPVCLRQIGALVSIGVGERVSIERRESDTNATTVAVDLAKPMFQLDVADWALCVIETHRFTRTQFERWFACNTSQPPRRNPEQAMKAVIQIAPRGSVLRIARKQLKAAKSGTRYGADYHLSFESAARCSRS